jgi:hypothetical protein
MARSCHAVGERGDLPRSVPLTFATWDPLMRSGGISLSATLALMALCFAAIAVLNALYWHVIFIGVLSGFAAGSLTVQSFLARRL